MFGDSLSISQSRKLITSLSKCQNPFHCAHGRPAVCFILNANALHAKLKKNQAYKKPLPRVPANFVPIRALQRRAQLARIRRYNQQLTEPMLIDDDDDERHQVE